MDKDSYPRLLGFIGGAGTRTARQAEPAAPASELKTSVRAEHDWSLAAAPRALVGQRKGRPAALAIRVASPILGEPVPFTTTHPRSYSMSGRSHISGLKRLNVLNDFIVLALSPPAMQPAEGGCDAAAVCTRVKRRAGIDRFPFRERYAAKRRFREYLDAIPTAIIDAQLLPSLGAGPCSRRG